MSADRSAAQDLAGEEGPSSSEGLRQDTRTSNSEMYDNSSTRFNTPGRQSASCNEGVSLPHALVLLLIEVFLQLLKQWYCRYPESS